MSRHRELFVYVMGRHGWRFESIRAALRSAAVVQRWGQVDCSVPTPSVRARHEAASRRAEQRLCDLAAEYRWGADFDGDSRGCVVTLTPPAYAVTAGGYPVEPVAVPADGYRDAQMERLGCRR